MPMAIVMYGCKHGVPRNVRVDAGSGAYARRMRVRDCRYCPGDADAGKRAYAAARKADIPTYDALIEAAGIKSGFRADDDGHDIRNRTRAIERRKHDADDKRTARAADKRAAKLAAVDASTPTDGGPALDLSVPDAGAWDAPVVARAADDDDRRAALRRGTDGDASA